MRRARGCLALALSLSLAAQAQELPPSLGLLVLLKVVTYDAHFAARGTGDFLILVVHDEATAQEARELAKAGAALDVKKVQERPLRFEPVPLEALEARLQGKKAAAVLLPGSLGGPGLSTALAAATRAQVYTLCLSEAQVRAGAFLGVGLSGGKPQPQVNAAAARALGVELPPSVLRLVRAF